VGKAASPGPEYDWNKGRDESRKKETGMTRVGPRGRGDGKRVPAATLRRIEIIVSSQWKNGTGYYEGEVETINTKTLPKSLGARKVWGEGKQGPGVW